MTTEATHNALREWDGEPLGNPITWFAFVPYAQSEDAYLIAKGPVMTLDSCGEMTYAECEYGGLTGLVAFDGHVHTRAAFAAAGYGWPHEDEFDEWFTGEWRRMTAEEAAALGLITGAA